jgi:hypothetical protein
MRARGDAPRPEARTTLPKRIPRASAAASVAFVAQLQHSKNINSVSFSPNGALALTTGDAAIKLWDAATLTVLRTMHGHAADVEVVAFLPDGRRPDGLYGLSSSYDESTRLWRLDDGYSMAMVARRGEWLAYTSDGYFDASRRGGELVAAVQGNQAFRIDQLALTNNRPDQMMQSMGFTSRKDEEVAAYYRTPTRTKMERCPRTSCAPTWRGRSRA